MQNEAASGKKRKEIQAKFQQLVQVPEHRSIHLGELY